MEGDRRFDGPERQGFGQRRDAPEKGEAENGGEATADEIGERQAPAAGPAWR